MKNIHKFNTTAITIQEHKNYQMQFAVA